jgi:hypothetical protein
VGSSTGYGFKQAGDVDMLQVILSGAAGGVPWQCQSSASSVLQDAVSRLTSGRLLRSFPPGEFTFEGPEHSRHGSGRLAERLTAALGAPPRAAPAELQERLIAAGLFDELQALRWGSQPFLPKAAFTPSGSEQAHLYRHSPAFTRIEQRMSERLRAAGVPDHESMLDQRAEQMGDSAPGCLMFEVEVGRARVPGPERFRELLEHAVRIADINRHANPPRGAG